MTTATGRGEMGTVRTILITNGQIRAVSNFSQIDGRPEEGEYIHRADHAAEIARLTEQRDDLVEAAKAMVSGHDRTFPDGSVVGVFVNELQDSIAKAEEG